MKQFIYLLKAILLSVFFTLAVSCKGTGGGTEEEGAFDVQISVPKTIEIPSDNPQATFKVLFGKAPLKTDIMSFKDASGRKIETPIVSVSEKNVVVNCQNIVTSGDYTVVVSRSSKELELGRTSVILDDGVKPSEGSNIYGLVSVDGKGLADVVISDGVEVVRTNSDGVYSFKSNKKYGYVFISTPSGYMPGLDGVLPMLHKKVEMGATTKVERVDFQLFSDGDQTNHTMLTFGDMHLAGGRNNDRVYFSKFCQDVKEYVENHKFEKVYALTLGDMTWDYYWYSNKYVFEQYLEDVSQVGDLTIFHTIGNHDHDMNLPGDFENALQFTRELAPDYYSFNIGKVHYIILDDILSTSKGGGRDDRKYNELVTDEEFAWMEKDLSYVPKNYSVVVAMHATTGNLDTAANRDKLVSLCTGFANAQFFTGHTHKFSHTQRGTGIYDHNTGAVCSDWWNTANNTGGKINIGQDGGAAGYSIYKISGNDFKWQFKPTGISEDYQFRTYDRNKVNLSADVVMPSAPEANKARYNAYAVGWVGSSTSNEVFINVWNYGPGWKIEVTEDGKALTVNQVDGNVYRDPLHLLVYLGKSMATSTSETFATSGCGHMWKVTASSATSTLDIKVTDCFGNVYSETMKRPKEFKAETYYK